MTFFVMGTTFFINDLSTNLGLNVNTSYNETYNKIDDMVALANNATDQLQGGEVATTTDAALQIASFPVIKMVMNSFSVMIGIVEDLVNDLNIPDWVLPLIVTIISVSIIFAVINAFFGRNT